MPKKKLTIRIEKYQREWLIKASRQKGISVTGIIRWLIDKAIK